jgi:hypothetical protein
MGPDVANMLSSQDYAQVVAGATPLAGTFNTAYVGDPTNGTLITYLQVFLAQAAYQHSSSYPIVLLVPALNNLSIIARGATASATTGIRMVPRLARPIIKGQRSLGAG